MTERIVRTENLFPRRFADMIERPWGLLFVTPTIRDSYDGNHACVLRRGTDMTAVVDEIVTFYRNRDLTPRVNYVSADGDDPNLRQALEADGFTIDHHNTMRLYLLTGLSRIAPNPTVIVRRHDCIDDSMLAVLASINNLRMARVLQRRLVDPDAWLFVGQIDGHTASVALLEQDDDICRIDEVHTAQVYRGRGCARAVIHALVAFYRQQCHAPLVLWTDNPVAERLYVEAGFQRLAIQMTSWVAWQDDQ